MKNRDYVVVKLTNEQNKKLEELYERHFSCEWGKPSTWGMIVGQPDMNNKRAVFSYLTYREALIVQKIIELFNFLKGYKPLGFTHPLDNRMLSIRDENDRP